MGWVNAMPVSQPVLEIVIQLVKKREMSLTERFSINQLPGVSL